MQEKKEIINAQSDFTDTIPNTVRLGRIYKV